MPANLHLLKKKQIMIANSRTILLKFLIKKLKKVYLEFQLSRLVNRVHLLAIATALVTLNFFTKILEKKIKTLTMLIKLKPKINLLLKNRKALRDHP